MKQFRAVAGIAAIFVLGVMIGVLGTSLVVSHRMESFHKKGPPPIRPMFMKQIVNRLDLTPAQQAEVEKMVDTLQAELRTIRRDFHPRVKAAFDACFERINQHLTGDQKKKLAIIREQLPKHFPPDKDFRRHRECPPDQEKGIGPPEE
jgi:hypothetical protein